MELRQYWEIIWQRRLLVIGFIILSFIASLVSVASISQPVSTYQGTVRISAKPTNIPQKSYETYGEYYLFVASEYLNDDIIHIVESDGFLEALKRKYGNRPEGAPNGSIKGKKAHRVMAFTVTSEREGDAKVISQGIVDILSSPSDADPKYIQMLTDQEPKITMVEAPSVIVLSSPIRRGAVDVAVRTSIGIVVALALAFLFYYLDDTLRDRREAERYTGLSVLGEIPRPARGEIRA